MGTSDFLFHVPLQVTISIPVREKNAHFAVAQAQGRLEFLFEMLDALKDKGESAGMQLDEVIMKLEGFWEDMVVLDIKEDTDDNNE